MKQWSKSGCVAGIATAMLSACGGGDEADVAMPSAAPNLAAAAVACQPAWHSGTVYWGGSVASQAGRNYTAAYWTQGQNPTSNSGAAGSGQPWIIGAVCGGSSPTPTPAPTPTPRPTPVATPTPVPAAGGRAAALPIGIENVNDSPLKAASYRTLLRFVPTGTITIDRFYFGFKLRGASCDEPNVAGYGKGDGGLLRANLVQINPATGLPGAVIATETVNACTRHNEAKAELDGSTPVLAWVNTPATLQGGTMYGVVISNAHADPAGNFFSFNMPLADTTLAGPHARNELNPNAQGALMSLDPREHVAWSSDNGNSWKYGSENGQYRSYMNDRDLAHPATRLPQYGFRLSNGTRLGGQPYYAYSADCVGCTVTYANTRYARTFTEVGGFTASGSNVGALTLRNISTGAQSSCTPSLGYGLRKCTLAAPVTVAAGQSYTVQSSGSVELMKLDYSQQLLFPTAGTANGEFRMYQANLVPGTKAKDVPSLWAGPTSAYYN
ncbi:hypothetical protein [Chitinolyticbacter meiyuanensis]|uniref:hypothetical protein n=1 Tax=Chitinolyticbacter meiyuanensis TaxID=682798 RepID=UPI0011E5C29C|nr:hypothetical protein [Chitinolyticbacter meiyuanensis]